MADTAPTVDSAMPADATATVVVAKAAPAPKAAAAAAEPSTDATRLLPEPLLDENPNRWTMLPIKYPAIWEMYKKAEASFWTGEFAARFERGRAHMRSEREKSFQPPPVARCRVPRARRPHVFVFCVRRPSLNNNA